MDVENKQKILDFLNNHTLAVIATCHPDGTPEAAVIDFSIRDDLELVFDTFNQTRKYSNLLAKRGVALVVGWDQNITVQYEGDAFEVPAPAVAQYQKEHLDKVPFEGRYIEEGAVMFKVIPRWIRFSDFTKEPPEIIEIDMR
jgi:hypothetical protein